MTEPPKLPLKEQLEYYQDVLKLNCIPLFRHTKVPDIPGDDNGWKIYQTKKYAGSFKENNDVGIVCGTTSGRLVVVDLDDKTILKDIFDDVDNLLNSTMVSETKRGNHILMEILGELPENMTLIDAKGRQIDILSQGRFFRAPPSAPCRWLSNGKIQTAATFATILAQLNAKGFYRDGKMHGITDSVDDITGWDMEGSNFVVHEGVRHSSSLKYLNFLPLTKGISSWQEFESIADMWNQEHLKPPIENPEWENLKKDCWEHAQRVKDKQLQPRQKYSKKTWDTPAMADLMIQRFYPKTFRETDVIYVYMNGKYVRKGESWISESIQGIFYGTPPSKINEVLSTIRQTTYIKSQRMDENRHIHNFKNYMYDLLLDEKLNHSPMYLSSIQFNANYIPSAKCPAFDKFYSEIMPDLEDSQTVLEMLSTVFLRFEKIEKVMIFFGSKNNGKSTLLEIFGSIIGEENMMAQSLQDLTSDRFSLFTLVGKVANVYADLPEDTISHINVIKMLTSQDSINVQNKFEESFITKLFIRLIFSANDLPEIKHDNDAVYKRFWPIEFPIEIVPEEMDLRILDKLCTETEKSGVLNILLKYARELLKNNLKFKHPQSIEETKRIWMAKTSLNIGKFMENSVDDGKGPKAFISNPLMKEVYQLWCRDNDEKIHTQKILNQKILKVSKLTVARGGTKNKPLRGFRGGVFKGEYAKYNKEDDKETPNSQTKIDGVQMIH